MQIIIISRLLIIEIFKQMKKSYFKILLLSSAVILVSCKQSITLEQLESKDGLSYYNSSPFTGICSDYFADGKLKAEMFYENGYLDGEYISYFNNGNIESEGTYQQGNRTGEWKRCWKNMLSQLRQSVG